MSQHSNQPIPWEQGRPGDAAPLSYLAARSVKRQLLEELRAGQEEGNAVRAEDLLPRWPGDPQEDPDLASLLLQEYCQRLQHNPAAGDQPQLEEYEQRFPAQQGSLASLLRQHEVLRSVAGVSGGSGLDLALPDIGDELFGFRLRAELGRGSFARVFLAEQAVLAGRPVVVKVSAIEGEEPQTLAQLQHTHIVPIYSVHEDSRAGVRAVCMPYFGGASLSRVLHALWSANRVPAHGQELVEALMEEGGWRIEDRGWRIEDRGSRIEDRGSRIAKDTGVPLHPPSSILDSPSSILHPPSSILDPPSSTLDLLAGLSYPQAAAWIVARLAEGLQHAHDRGVLHCDIKPSNVLLGADGQPLLLDFNLAQQMHSDQGRVQATLGGTVAYMAPEHLRAMATRDPALVRQVDQRTDVYALGMILFEMLVGKRPFEQSGSYSPMPALIEAMAVERSRSVPSLRGLRPDLPWGLESIIRTCLAPIPAERYQHAEHLADDLRRFLEDRPLRYAPELSWRERAHKWLRRHPRLAAAGAVAVVAAVLLMIGAAVLSGIQSELAATQARAQKAQRAQARQRKQEFQAGAVRALCLVNTSAAGHDQVGQGLKVCEQTLALYGVLDREHWQTHPDWQALPADEQKLLAEDVREVLLLLARARVKTASARFFGKQPGHRAPTVAAVLAPTAQGPLACLTSWAAGQTIWGPQAASLRQARRRALRQALALLKRAEAIPGLSPSPALWEERAWDYEQLGDAAKARTARQRARALPPAGARDHYLLATAHADQGRHSEAVAELNRALAKNPRHYWSWFQRGLCYQEQHEYALALSDFGACVALWPEFAWGHFNRGLLLHELEKKTEARAAYTAALQHDPDLVAAYLARGLVNVDLNRHRQALADFDAAAARGLDSADLHGNRGLALERLGRHREADAAFRRAWAHDPNNVSLLLGYGFAVSERLPEKAQAAFIKVLQRQPRNPLALYGQGMLWTRQSRGSPRALWFFNQAVAADPTLVAAHRGRARELAYRGEEELARQDMDWCVAVEPTGVTHYAAACVYALLAEKAATSANPVQAEALKRRAVLLLREALTRGYGKDRAATDSDLKSIWRHPEFRRLGLPPPTSKR